MTRAVASGILGLLLVALAGGCGGGGGGAPSASSTTTDTTSTTRAGGVLPVARNPISNASAAAGLTITKVLVENNVSPESGKAVPDHLEVSLRNTSATPLKGIGLYYKITDRTKGVSQGYYTILDGLTIEPGATRVVHFDDTGAAGHYPVDKYSLYYTDRNALVVAVTASAPHLKPATFTVRKDSADAEAGVEG
jgi:hypothetical protein